jgi:hypothetical protein
MPILNHPPLECDGALSDLILQAARQAIPSNVEQMITLPDCSVRNQPLLPLLEGLLDSAQATAAAVADNAWDESRPMNRGLMTDLARQARLIASMLESAANCPDSRA